MGTGSIIVCGRKVTSPKQYEGYLAPTRAVDGWLRPFSYSQEFVLYTKGIPVGEIYELADQTWQARVYPHIGKSYDTQDEAMLFLEAIAALGL